MLTSFRLTGVRKEPCAAFHTKNLTLLSPSMTFWCSPKEAMVGLKEEHGTSFW